MQNQYINLQFDPLIQGNGRYLATVFHCVPKNPKDNLLGIASEVAAESSTGSNLRVSTATEFSDNLNALVYKIDEGKNLIWIAYPWAIFDRGGNVQNIMTYIAGNIYGMGNLSALKLLDVWFPKEMLQQYDGPATTLHEVRKYLNVYDRPILGTIVKPKIGLRPKEFGQAVYEFWRGGGDFVKHDEPQADQVFCPFEETVHEIAKMMEQIEKETGEKKIYSFNISAADFETMGKRANRVIEALPQGSYCFLVDGITAGWTAVQAIRRKYPQVFLHFHRAGHGAYTRPENAFGYSVPVLSKMSRLAGASGMHTGTAGIGKMAGTVEEDIVAANLIWKQISKGPFFEQNWGTLKPTCPIISGGLNPLKLKPFIEAIGHVDFITTMGAGVHAHPGGTRKGATALRQACEAWQKNIPLETFAKTHEELAQAVKFYGRE